MNPSGAVQIPDLRALLNLHRDEIFASLNCHQVGRVVSVDAAKQTVQVELGVKRVVYNQTQTTDEELQTTPAIIAYPILADVPFVVLSGAGARVTFPIAIGDPCLVLFNDRDLDQWWTSGASNPPNSSRMHSLSDAIALVGIRPLSDKFTNYNAEDLELRFGDSTIRITATGEIVLTQAEGATVHLKADGAVSIAGAGGGAVEIFANGTIAITAEGGTEISLSEKVGASNSATSLLEVMNSVVTALNALNAKTGPSASIQIATAQAQISALLQ